ncbi:MAG: heme-dependent oxidative N-demethylase subunit alpha family protein [Chthoniobacterales bacterium]
MSFARLFPDADYRHHLSVKRGDLAAFFAHRPDHDELIAERRHWLDRDRDNYAAALDSAAPAIKETAEVIGAECSDQHNASATIVRLGGQIEPDIVILEKNSDSAFRVVAGCVCFPSSWSFPEKLGLPLDAVHTVVPDLNSALGTPMARFLGKIQPGASWERSNWGLSSSPARNQHSSRNTPRLVPPLTLDRVWLRVEDQILSILPQTGALLFAIRIVTLPLSELRTREPDAAAGLRRALATLTDEMAAYKNLAAARDHIVALLDRD